MWFAVGWSDGWSASASHQCDDRRMKPSRLVDVSALASALQTFADERDWNSFHSPKNLAMALTGEVGELVELFQWLTEDESHRVGQDPATARAVRDELADVLMFLVRLASVLDVDIDEAVRQKLAANAQKYPAGDSTPKRR
jgi:dCTP diphosphatase